MASSIARRALSQWLSEHALRLGDTGAAGPGVDRLFADARILADARIVVLGETNHFVHEKVDFRLWWLRELAKRRRLVLAEELGWCDGRRVEDYLLRGDDDALARVATFGYRGYRRTDRDDSPAGILADAFRRYPHDLMKSEHVRLYRALRELPAIEAFVGLDVDAPGHGYDAVEALASAIAPGRDETFRQRLQRVPGETVEQESARLKGLLALLSPSAACAGVREALLSLTESLDYAVLAHAAPDYQALRPAMALREQTMKRRLESVLDTLAPGQTLVIMGHAFHLAKDDEHIRGQGVGPGGGQVPSLGHHLVQRLGHPVRSVWMLYGGGSDAQPFPDLPRVADYPDDTLNRWLLDQTDAPLVLAMTDEVRPLLRRARIGHLYNGVDRVDLGAEADALTFYPTVTPLRPDL